MPIPSVELGVPSPTHREGRTRINGRTVRKSVRWLVGLVVVAHGAIHLLGAVKGFGWAKVTLLVEPIGGGLGVVWFIAAVLTVAAGALLLARVSWWWMVGALAVVVSQAVIITSWADAKVGTVANAVLAFAVVYGWASQGPRGARAEYRRRATAALATNRPAGMVTETDLVSLPAPVAAYVRRSGALGRPRVETLHARFHGRIRGGPTKPWMTFTGGAATMRVRALSLFPMVDASGPEMDRAETVTIFNDGDDDDELVDFFSDDRNAVSTDGKTFTPQRWSTPISAYRDLGSARVGTIGEGHWHAADGEFTYLEFDLDDITYNAADLDHPRAVSGA